MMNRNELVEKYIEFFKNKKHKEIKNSSLVPDNDPTVLFTTAGMHPLVPYLLGQKHPLGDKLVDVQRCIRTGDIEEVGDDTHLTFFEMLGNWSLGDYFKEGSIKFSFEFLTEVLKIDKEKLAFTCFEGDKNVGKDEESFNVWKSLGVSEKKIKFLGKEDNWWGPAGETGPCGPDSEIFYWTGDEAPEEFDTNDDKWVEIWNNVFMQYNKLKDGSFEELKNKNVDTGMGVERTIMLLQDKKNVFETDIFLPIINKIQEFGQKSDEKSERIIADHIKASVFILNEKVEPSNLGRGYVLRRLIRRVLRYSRLLNIQDKEFLTEVAKVVIDLYKDTYDSLKKNEIFIFEELKKEEERFRKSLSSGLKIFEKEISNVKGILPSKVVFTLFASYGFPLEMTRELAEEKGFKIDEDGFWDEFKKHQELSRKATKGTFTSGLADNSEKVTEYHTVTHLLLQALRNHIDDKIEQRGSNITSERIRFDFSFDRKLEEDEVKVIENEVNEKILEKLDVVKKEMSVEEAKEQGATGIFDDKYGDVVSVYFVGDYSKEICAGPHVNNTEDIKGKFKIKKQESSSAGVRRIKAVLE